MDGQVRKETRICVKGIELGRVGDIQNNGKSMESAEKGRKVAVSVVDGGETCKYGRHFGVEDLLYSGISGKSMKAMKKLYGKEYEENRELLVRLRDNIL